jgi:hypothetical protein
LSRDGQENNQKNQIGCGEGSNPPLGSQSRISNNHYWRGLVQIQKKLENAITSLILCKAYLKNLWTEALVKQRRQNPIINLKLSIFFNFKAVWTERKFNFYMFYLLQFISFHSIFSKS